MSRRSLQSDWLGLCGCNLKEKLECSNGIHDGKNWHQIRISRSGERQKICRIVAMKIRGTQENLAACVVDGTHTIKTWTWFKKWNTYQVHEFEKTFHYCIIRRSEVTWGLLFMSCYCIRNVSPVSLQFVFWSFGPLSKTCLLQKRLPLSAEKAMVIFHVCCDFWCLYSFG